MVATGATVSECEQKYIQMLAQKGITTQEALPQTEAGGVIAEIRSAVMDGNTYYFLRLTGEDVFYSVSAKENPIAVTLNVGDRVTISHEVAPDEPVSILSGTTVTLDRKAASAPAPTPAVSTLPAA